MRVFGSRARTRAVQADKRHARAERQPDGGVCKNGGSRRLILEANVGQLHHSLHAALDAVQHARVGKIERRYSLDGSFRRSCDRLHR